MTTTVKSEWLDYLIHDVCMGSGDSQPSQIQIKETEKAFYAGVFAVMSILKKIDQRNISDEDGAVHLQGIYYECLSFRTSGK